MKTGIDPSVAKRVEKLTRDLSAPDTYRKFPAGGRQKSAGAPQGRTRHHGVHAGYARRHQPGRIDVGQILSNRAMVSILDSYDKR